MRQFEARRAGAAFVAGLLLTALPGIARAACVGNCDGNAAVAVNEIITMVNIALGTATIDACTAGDADSSGDIAVNEIVQGVNNALNGCPAELTPTPTATDATPPTPTPTLGALGTKHFVVGTTTAKSSFTAVLDQGLAIPLAPFLAQNNGVTGQPAFLDFEVGAPDASGLAMVNITAASEYFYADARALAQLVLCLKPLVPVTAAGVLACNGGLEVGINLNVNHNLGQLGVDGFTEAQCTALNGTLEGPNQVCAAGRIGDPCRVNADCDTASAAGDGTCGLRATTCTDPESKRGTACRADGDCDTTAEAADGVCGTPKPHPGVCNGGFDASATGGDAGVGAMTLAPVPEFDLQGLPVELTIEDNLPCGDEGASGGVIGFAMTTGVSRSKVLNFSNQSGVCSAGRVDSDCHTDADCDLTPGDGVCGKLVTYETHGQNFSCSNWSTTNGPGCFVLTAPQLDSNPSGGDIITAFKFCAQ